MRYLFYPGCSAEGSALEYKTSTVAIFSALGVELQELQDWTCCGASVAAVKSGLLGLALPARSLALAEAAAPGEDLLVICSACYTNFRRTSAEAKDPAVLRQINRALEVEGLVYRNTVRARHVLDVLANDVGASVIGARVRRPLAGLTVAPYYGCQTVRPHSPFDDPQAPVSMVAIIEALGAAAHRHSHEALCCGTSLSITKPELGLKLVAAVLDAAGVAGCAATVCPMCHTNLDSYQRQVGQMLGHRVRLPIMHLTQLIGLAFGLSPRQLLLERHLVPVKPVLDRLETPIPHEG